MRSDLAHLLAEGDRGVDGVLRGLKAGDNLDALLDGYGVHEMCADYTGGGRKVGGVLGCASCDFGNGDGGCVGRQDSVRRADLGQLCEYLALEIRDFLSIVRINLRL